MIQSVCHAFVSVGAKLTIRLGPASRSRPISAAGPSISRSIRSVDVDYAPVPSPRPNSGRNAIAQSPAQTLRKPSPAYDSTSALQFPATRASQTFGSLSRYQDEQLDAEAVMEQYVNFDPDHFADQDSPSPPPAQTSSPPQISRKVVHSPLASRTPKRTVDPVVEEDEEEGGDINGTVSRQAKGKQRATEELDERSPLPLSRKSNAKSRHDLVDEGADEVSPGRKSGRRSSGDVEPLTSKMSIKNRASAHANASDDLPADERYDGPLLDNGDDFDQNPMGMDVSPRESEPPLSATEHSDAESDQEPLPSKKKGKTKEKGPTSKGKEKAPESKKKKRPREEDEDSVRQKKKPKSTDSRATGRGRTRTPDPDRSYLEGNVHISVPTPRANSV